MINLKNNIEIEEGTKISKENKPYPVLFIRYKGMKLGHLYLSDEVRDKIEFADLHVK